MKLASSFIVDARSMLCNAGDAQQSRHVAVQKAAHPTSPAIIDTAEMRRAIETATLKAKQLGEERFRQSDN